MLKILSAVFVVMSLSTTTYAHWGPYHYLSFIADGEEQTIRVKGDRWDCNTKHRYNLHWTEKFVMCSK